MPDLSQSILLSLEALASHHRKDGGYARYMESEVSDLYGTAAAIGILTTVGRTLDAERTSELAAILRTFQEPDGRFVDPSHGTVHSTATGIGALYLLQQEITMPLFLHPLLTPTAAVDFLDALDWTNPWLASHDAAGLLAIAAMTGAEDAAWFGAYIDWLQQNVDSGTGFWRTGGMGSLDQWPGFFGNLGCSFHFHFLFRHLGHRIPHAAAVVDSCLRLYEQTPIIRTVKEIGYPHLDWAYSLNRATRQERYRETETLTALRRETERLAASQSVSIPRAAEDLHTLAAVIALIAELRTALGEDLVTGHDLTPTMDLRPFI